MENEVVDYVKQARKHGLSDKEIKQNLLDAGWDAGTVDESFAFAKAYDNKPYGNADEDIKTIAHAKPDVLPSGLEAAAKEESSLMDNPALSQGREHYAETEKNSKFSGLLKKPVFWISLIFIAAVSAGALAFYSLVYTNPEKIWSNFLEQSAQATPFDTSFRLSYGDQKSKMTFEGNSYSDYTNPNNPKTSSDLSMEMSDGSNSFKKNFKYLLFNDNLFLDFGQLESLDIPEQKDGSRWMKLDMGMLNNYIEQENSSRPEQENFQEGIKQISSRLSGEIGRYWKESGALKTGKYVGKEKIGDITTYHFKNSVDNEALRNFFKKSLSAIQESLFQQSLGGEAGSLSESQVPQQTSSPFVDKIEIKELETWIGASDYRLYKIKMVASAPSIGSADWLTSSLIPPNAGEDSSRDLQRLTDAQSIALALELYHQDNSGYPEADTGSPVGLKTAYIDEMPTPPAPPDGGCTEYYNTYWYEPEGEPFQKDGVNLYPSYSLTFCLGEGIGEYEPGIAAFSPQGIKTNIPCPAADQNNCPKAVKNESPASRPGQMTESGTSAEFRLEASFSNYGKTRELRAPEEYYDILSEFAGNPI